MKNVNSPGHGGRILNVTTVSGYVGQPAFSIYAAGKFGKALDLSGAEQRMTYLISPFEALEGFTEAVAKEMLPEWNIKAVILETGSFASEFRQATDRIPPHPSYSHSGERSPTALFKKSLPTSKSIAIGDVAKAARAMMLIATFPDPPLRIQLGTDSLVMIRKKAQQTLDDTYTYEELAHSTNSNSIQVDKERLMDILRNIKI